MVLTKWNTLGFSLYIQLLNQITESGQIEPDLPDIDLGCATLIDHTFIPDIETRYHYYHQISCTQKIDGILKVSDELSDRFGPLPIETQNLLDQAIIRVLSHQLGIRKIHEHRDDIILELGTDIKIDPTLLLDLIQTHPEYGIAGATGFKIIKPSNPIQACHQLLLKLQSK